MNGNDKSGCLCSYYGAVTDAGAGALAVASEDVVVGSVSIVIAEAYIIMTVQRRQHPAEFKRSRIRSGHPNRASLRCHHTLSIISSSSIQKSSFPFKKSLWSYRRHYLVNLQINTLIHRPQAFFKRSKSCSFNLHHCLCAKRQCLSLAYTVLPFRPHSSVTATSHPSTVRFAPPPPEDVHRRTRVHQ